MSKQNKLCNSKKDIFIISTIKGTTVKRFSLNGRIISFFLKKMGEHLLPHCNILAWCLMPNHFHWMVEVTKRDIVVAHGGVSQSNLASGNHPAKSLEKLRSINDSIGILLRSYTRAINKAHKKSGSLFRPKTKAECLTCIDGITPAFFNTKYGTIINIKDPPEKSIYNSVSTTYMKIR